MNKKKPTAQAMATVIWAQVKPEMGLVSIRVVAANRCGGRALSHHGGSCLDKEGVCSFEVGCRSFHVISSRLDSKI